MANLVENNLIITGDIALELGKRLYEHGMAYFRPRPQYLSEEPILAPTMNNDLPRWYIWSLDHWGTKWDIYEEQRELTTYSDQCIEVAFITANSSIEPFCDWLSEQYPQLRLELFSREELEETFTKTTWEEGIIQ